MELYKVQVNKANGQPFVNLKKTDGFVKDDLITIKKSYGISKEQLEDKIKTNKTLNTLLNEINKLHTDKFKDVRWNFIKKIKEKIGFKINDEDEGFTEFNHKGINIEYDWGEGFNDDFGDRHIPFTLFTSSYSEDFLKNYIDNDNILKEMLDNTYNLYEIKIYTDLVEMYHKNRINKIYSICREIIKDYKLYEIKNIQAGEYIINYDNMVIKFDYVEGILEIQEDDVSIFF